MFLPAQTADSACGICAVQALVDALDTEASAENLDSVKAQLTAIDQAMMEFDRALKNRTAQGVERAREKLAQFPDEMEYRS